MGNGGKFRGRVEVKRRQLDFKEKQEIEQRTTQHGGSPPRGGGSQTEGELLKTPESLHSGGKDIHATRDRIIYIFVAVRATSLRDASSNFLMKVRFIISVCFSIGCGV